MVWGQEALQEGSSLSVFDAELVFIWNQCELIGTSWKTGGCVCWCVCVCGYCVCYCGSVCVCFACGCIGGDMFGKESLSGPSTPNRNVSTLVFLCAPDKRSLINLGLGKFTGIDWVILWDDQF